MNARAQRGLKGDEFDPELAARDQQEIAQDENEAGLDNGRLHRCEHGLRKAWLLHHDRSRCRSAALRHDLQILDLVGDVGEGLQRLLQFAELFFCALDCLRSILHPIRGGLGNQ